MSNGHAVKIRTVIWVGFAVALGAAAVLSPLTCSGREPAAKSDEKLSPTAPSLRSTPDTESDKDLDDPFANTPPAKKADLKPAFTDPFPEPNASDAKTPAKTGKHSDNPFEEKAPGKGPADANLSEDQIEGTIAKDPRFQQAVLELAELVKREGEAAKQGTGKPADQGDARIRDAIEGLRQKFEKAQERQWQKSLEQPIQNDQLLSANLQPLFVEHQLLEAQYNQVTDKISRQAKSVQDLEKFSGEADQLRSDIDQLKAIVKDMGTTLIKRKIELDAGPRVSILEQASTPELGSPTQQYVVAGIGTLTGLLFVLIGVALYGLLFGKRNVPRNPGLESIGPTAPIRSTRRAKWGLAIVFGVLLGGTLGALGWFLFQAKYESAALVRVSIVDPAIWEPHSGIDFAAYKQNMIEMIKSPPIVGKAVEDRTVQDFPIYRKNSADPVNWLSDAVQITGGNSELIHVALRSEDPQGLKEIVDAVLAAFTSEVIDRARTEKLNETDGLEKKFNSLKAQVLDKERQLYNLSQQIGTTDSRPANVQHRMQADALDTLLRLRTDIQRKISDLDFRLALTKSLKDLEEKTSGPATNRDAPIATESQAERQILELSKLLRQLTDKKKASGNQPTDAAARTSTDIASLQERTEKISAADRQHVIERMKKN